MSKARFIGTIAALLALLMTVPSYAQGPKVGTTSMQFLKIIPDARAVGMGGAVSTMTNTSSAVFTNPSGLAEASSFDAALGYADWFAGMGISSGAVSYSLGNIGTVGLHIVHLNVGDIAVTRVDELGFEGDTFNPGLTGESISPSSTVAGLSFARWLTPKFTFGATAKVAREDLVSASATQVLFDGGLTYRTGYRSIALSIMIRNFGPEVKFANEGFPTPQTFDLGISSYLMAPDEAMFLHSSNQTMRVAFEVSHPRDYGQQYNVGAEYGIYDTLFLRGGYRLDYDVQGLTLGGGLKLRDVRLDYSFNDYGENLSSVHRFTLGLSL